MNRIKASEFDDDILVEDFISGNTKSFEVLVLKHQDSVYNIIYRIVGDSEDALDISQEAFLLAFKNIRTYNSKYPFKSWLLRIGINRAIDHLRRRNTHRFRLGQISPYHEEGCESLTGNVPTTELSLSDEIHNPEASALMREEIDRLKEAMANLPPNYRAVIALYHFEGMNYREISKILRISRNTAKTWARRGRMELAKALKELRNKEEDHVKTMEVVKNDKNKRFPV